MLAKKKALPRLVKAKGLVPGVKCAMYWGSLRLSPGSTQNLEIISEPELKISPEYSVIEVFVKARFRNNSGELSECPLVALSVGWDGKIMMELIKEED